jgi:hypothetical protein
MPDVEHRTLGHVLAHDGLRWGEMAVLRRGRIEILRRRLNIREAVAEISDRLSFRITQDVSDSDGASAAFGTSLMRAA